MGTTGTIGEQQFGVQPSSTDRDVAERVTFHAERGSDLAIAGADVDPDLYRRALSRLQRPGETVPLTDLLELPETRALPTG